MSTLSRTAVTPTSLGSFTEGAFTFAADGNDAQFINPSLVLLNSSFIPIAANDDASATTFDSSLTRSLAAGTYYLAVANSELRTNRAADADDAYRDAAVLDSPGILLTSAGFQNESFTFSVTDGLRTANGSFLGQTKYRADFYTFTVNPVPEPATMAALGLGALALLKRRRKS